MLSTPTLFEAKKKRKASKFTFIDLFAGIGGTRIGFERAGGECVFTSEWDENCKKTYEANFHEIPYGDITQISTNQINNFDVLLAGFPCQPFSSIGKRQGFMHATQGTLFYEILRILKEKKGKDRPKSFLLENVPGLLTHDGGNTFDTLIKALDEIGYYVFKDVLDSANFGVPQHRKRVYIVGFRKDLFPDIKFIFPQTNGKVSYINEHLEKNAKGYSISKHLQETYLFKIDDGRPKIVNSKSKIQVKTLVSSYHKIQRLTGTFVEDGETGIRLFTENECKAIMGFDKDFIVPVSRTQMYRQFGNSVVIPVIQEIAKQIAKKINPVVKEERIEFKRSSEYNYQTA